MLQDYTIIYFKVDHISEPSTLILPVFNPELTYMVTY